MVTYEGVDPGVLLGIYYIPLSSQVSWEADVGGGGSDPGHH